MTRECGNANAMCKQCKERLGQYVEHRMITERLRLRREVLLRGRWCGVAVVAARRRLVVVAHGRRGSGAVRARAGGVRAAVAQAARGSVAAACRRARVRSGGGYVAEWRRGIGEWERGGGSRRTRVKQRKRKPAARA